ncbi:THUMP domain-containing protein, partial [Vibrio sp. 10N.222.48.A8]|uniref:THUMP domain-containing protein n=1 Tax=Vibrio sp. 10N.222.48.A8 TaxID=3229606 RepID=UPI003551A5C3
MRKRFTRILECNIRNVIQRRCESVAVFNRRDHIEVTSESDQYYAEVLEALTHTPGIHHSLEVQQSEFKDLHDIYEQVLERSRADIEGKTFSVRAKRRGKHDFTS